MKRVVVPELLDDDRGTPRQVADSLADLRMFNRWFGGSSTTTELLRRVARRSGRTKLTFLDVAGASGDVSSHAAKALAREGTTLTTTVLDRVPTHLGRNGSAAACGSALQLPFADAAFDVVGSSLFLHHLEPPEISLFIRDALRVCRVAVIINDLRRALPHWLAAKAGTLIYKSPLTRHDAPVSVRRAYTESELRRLLAQDGHRHADFSRHYFYRMGAIIWRNQS